MFRREEENRFNQEIARVFYFILLLIEKKINKKIKKTNKYLKKYSDSEVQKKRRNLKEKPRMKLKRFIKIMKIIKLKLLTC